MFNDYFIVTLILLKTYSFECCVEFVSNCFCLSIACLASRPGQVGRADGYILEGKELEFYLKKIKAKKGK